MYLMLSWNDNRALARQSESTEAFRNGTAECAKPCKDPTNLRTDETEMDDYVMCCDNVWLPTITMNNVYSLPGGRLQSYKILVDKGEL